MSGSVPVVKLNVSTTGRTITGENRVIFRDSGDLSGDYGENELFSIIFDAGVNQKWSSIQFNDFHFEHATIKMWDMLSIQASNNTSTWGNFVVPWMQKPADDIIVNVNKDQFFFGNGVYDDATSKNGHILPMDPARAVELGYTGAPVTGIDRRYLRFHFRTDGGENKPGWDIVLTSDAYTSPQHISDLSTSIDVRNHILQNVTVPNNGIVDLRDRTDIYTIAWNCFVNSTYITEIHFPPTLKNLQTKGFYGCVNLSTVTFPLGSSFFFNRIPDQCFRGCNVLTGVDFLPGSVSTIGHRAFEQCGALTAVTLPNSIERLGEHCFSGCSLLETVTFPDNTHSETSTQFTSIPKSCFYNCVKLADVDFLPGSVSTIGASAFEHCGALTTVTLPNSIESLGVECFLGCSLLTTVDFPEQTPATFTSIATNCFRDCKALTINLLPGSVNTIGNYAFSGCSALTTVGFLPASVSTIGHYAFRGCSGLQSVILPGSIKSLGVECFLGCDALTTVDFSVSTPAQFTNIPQSCFQDCTALTTVGSLPASVSTIGDYAFRGCLGLQSVILPGSIESLGIECFLGCGALTTVDFPVSTPVAFTSIATSCFQDCTALTTVNSLPESVSTIGDYAFYGCSTLTAVNFLPESVSAIGQYAFSGCSGLQSVTLPGSIESLGMECFYGCSELTTVAFPVPTSTYFTDIPRSCFSGCSKLITVDFLPSSVSNISTSAFYGCLELESVTLPNSIVSLGIGCFSGCSVLTTVAFPEQTSTQFTTIPQSCFNSCIGLTTVGFLPESVTTIGNYAFDNCTNLRSVTLPSLVDNIGAYCFRDTGLEEVTLQNPGAVAWTSDVFEGCSGFTIFVKPGSALANNVTGTPIASFAGGTNVTFAPISTVCFLGGTRVTTTSGHGDVAIERLVPGVHRVADGRHVACVTRGRYLSSTLVKIQKGALGAGVPYEDVYVTPMHLVNEVGSLCMVPAAQLVLDNGLPGVSFHDMGYAPVVYNVLLTDGGYTHDMLVSGMACETLDPENPAATIFLERSRSGRSAVGCVEGGYCPPGMVVALC